MVQIPSSFYFYLRGKESAPGSSESAARLQSEPRAHRVAASTLGRSIRHEDHAAGGNRVEPAAWLDAPEVFGSFVPAQVPIADGGRSEDEQVGAAGDLAAAVGTLEIPRDGLARS